MTNCTYTANDLPMLRRNLEAARRTIQAIAAIPQEEWTIEDDRDYPAAVEHEAKMLDRIAKAKAHG